MTQEQHDYEMGCAAQAQAKHEAQMLNSEQKPQSCQTRVSCRAFVLERAKKHLGNKFKHFDTGQTLEEGYFTWSVSVSKFFGGMHVAYGGWVVWSACGGWLAEPCT